MVNYIVPFIELLASEDVSFLDNALAQQVYERRKLAKAVIAYFALERDGKETTEVRLGYYRSLAQLLQDPDYRRILLYLPLSALKNAPLFFREAYLNAWHELLNIQDARENFYEGDTFEVQARPNGKLERVVKCAHLTPWLIDAGYLGYHELTDILNANVSNEVLLRSFANTLRLISDRELLSESQLQSLRQITAHVDQRERLEPLYVSDKRCRWLQERAEQNYSKPLLTPGAELAGPFSANLPALKNDLKLIQASLKPDEIILVGGSRLKGYGVEGSDLDVFRLQKLESTELMQPGSPHAAHLYFNSVWVGGSNVTDLLKIATRKVEAYYATNDRRMAIERLENDLLQYRLLHKGYRRFMGGYDSSAKSYIDLDGDCPFYDDNYRRIATELFVKYIFIPQT